MEGDAWTLRKTSAQLLREAAEVSVALDRADDTIEGVPHYSAIEARAHEPGRQISREIQQRRMAEIVGSPGDEGNLSGLWPAVRVDRREPHGDLGGRGRGTAGAEGILPVVPGAIFSRCARRWALTPGN